MELEGIISPPIKVPATKDNLGEIEYHKGGGLSRSDIVACMKTPGHWLPERLDETPKEKTPALIFGDAFHTLVLEPHKFNDKFATLSPDINLRTKAGREIRDAIIDEGKMILKAEDMEHLNAMKKNYEEHPFVIYLNKGAVYERAVYWMDEPTGMIQKCKFDIIRPDKGIFSDVKTTDDASMQAWEKSIVKFNYDVQDAHYSTGAKEVLGFTKKMIFILVEKTPPYSVAIRFLDEATHDTGMEIRRRLLKRIKDFSETETYWNFESEAVTSGMAAYGHDVDSRIGRY